MKQNLKDYLIILIFTIMICIPLLNKNLDVYRDDGIQHIARLMGTYQSITEGEIPPVIMSNFCNGFGYSWNIFYSPLTAYVPLVIRIFTNSFEVILKLFMFLLSLLSGIAMYEFVKKVTKNSNAAILAGILYVLVPYRLTDMYMRVAISELASFVFLPIVFQGMYNVLGINEQKIEKAYSVDLTKNIQNNKNSFSRTLITSLLLTVGAVGLILTHIVMAMYAAIICLIYVLIHIKKLKDKKVLIMLGVNILLIILLTAFYIFPLLEHKVSTNYEVFQSGRMERTSELIRNKVDIWDLFYTQKGELSFEIGLVTLIGLVFTLLAYKKIWKDYKKLYWFSLITGIICIVMSLRFFPFEKLPPILKMIQFTFRLLEFASFFLIFVVAINYSLVIKNFRLRDVLILGFIAFLLVVPLNKNLDFEKVWTEDKLWPAVRVSENTGRVHAGCATFEYLPSKAFNNLDYIKERGNTAIIINGDATISNEIKTGTNMSFQVENVTTNTEIELPYIYYLGYDVTVVEANGKKQKIDTYESERGFVQISLSQGISGKIEIKYTGTTIIKISYIVSIVTFVGLIGLLILQTIFRYSQINRKAT